MLDDMELVRRLNLTRGTCGYMGVSFESSVEMQPEGRASRPMGQAIYFLVTRDAPVALHRILSDQIYHHYAGGPLEVLLVPEDGDSSVHVVGPDVDAGMTPQLQIPAGTFHTARVAGSGSALMGTTTWPSAIPEEVELGDRDVLGERMPSGW